MNDLSPLQVRTAKAKAKIVDRMHKGQTFSIAAIMSWTGTMAPGRWANMIATQWALQELVKEGVIERRDGKYGPNLSEGYRLL